MAPFATRADVVGDLPDGEVWERVGVASKGLTQDQKRPARPHFFAQCGDLLRPQRLRRHIDEVSFGRSAVLPIDRITRRIGEALSLHKASASISALWVLLMMSRP